MASTSTSSHIPGQRHERIMDSPRPNTTTPDPETSMSQKMLSAVTGSVFTSLLVTPLDVVRVRLQAQPRRPSPSSALPSFIQLPPNLGVTACCREVFWVQNQSQFCVASPPPPSSASSSASSLLASSAAHSAQSTASDCAAEESQRRTFNSTLDGLRKIARNEGILTLWRGLSPTLMMAVPGNVIYFAGYDWLRTSKLSPIEGRVSDVYAPLAAGSLARVLAAIVVSPIEMLRTRMQAHQTKEKNVMRATMVELRDMVGTQGYTSLWRGLTLTFWRDVPFSALYWWGYEFGRERLHEQRRRRGSMAGRELGTKELLTDSFIAGASSGLIAALVTTPFDVGKTRQQTVVSSNMSLEQKRALPESRTMPRFLWHIYRNEGMSGLFKGWAARCLKVAPACAIMISSYEIGKKMAVKVNEKED
ncbi:related to solute carrier family 25 member 39 [Ramularia collo-cygni]|uniref:Related to solute carrier family 25 member 39 n=1 Tax=Ramularia collo-cygni TaxID=112498 RepID=A0A2D3URU1_9PEZI|nr:related to solute carrier family 25 member 39 [Ramularia collo-cygni]CZT15230.1 related to solute carrier family 25 member 39 [Ramularia collo-cygni]